MEDRRWILLREDAERDSAMFILDQEVFECVSR